MLLPLLVLFCGGRRRHFLGGLAVALGVGLYAGEGDSDSASLSRSPSPSGAVAAEWLPRTGEGREQAMTRSLTCESHCSRRASSLHCFSLADLFIFFFFAMSRGIEGEEGSWDMAS